MPVPRRNLVTDTLVHTKHFDAPPAAVYNAIADSSQHTAMTGAPAEIGQAAGEPFTTHGGAIEGWTLDLAENERIVQAWRPADWPPGTFSIVRYDFVADGDGTELTLTHSSVPDGAGEHLDSGWNERYWGPLTEHLR